MKKFLMIVFLFLLPPLFIAIASYGSFVQENLKEKWVKGREQSFNYLYQASIEAANSEDDFFKNPYPSPDVVLSLLLNKYPPMEGGLYSHYKPAVDSLIKTNIGFLHPEIECSSPWHQIAMRALGSSDPQIILPNLIALIEIKKVPGFLEVCKDLFEHVKKQIKFQESSNEQLKTKKRKKNNKSRDLKRLIKINKRFSKIKIST